MQGKVKPLGKITVSIDELSKQQSDQLKKAYKALASVERRISPSQQKRHTTAYAR